MGWPGRRAVITVLVGAVVAGGLAAVLLRAGGSGSASGTTRASDAGAVAVGPTSVTGGIPTGFRHDEAGAVAAAVSYSGATGRLVPMGPIMRRDAAAAMATSATVDAQYEATTAAVEALTGKLDVPADQVWWVDVPATIRVVSFRPEAATVDVWGATVVGAETTSVQALWRTQRVELRWERGDWRVHRIDTREGPTPAGGDGALPARWAEFAAMGEWDRVAGLVVS